MAYKKKLLQDFIHTSHHDNEHFRISRLESENDILVIKARKSSSELASSGRKQKGSYNKNLRDYEKKW